VHDPGGENNKQTHGTINKTILIAFMFLVNCALLGLPILALNIMPELARVAVALSHGSSVFLLRILPLLEVVGTVAGLSFVVCGLCLGTDLSIRSVNQRDTFIGIIRIILLIVALCLTNYVLSLVESRIVLLVAPSAALVALVVWIPFGREVSVKLQRTGVLCLTASSFLLPIFQGRDAAVSSIVVLTSTSFLCFLWIFVNLGLCWGLTGLPLPKSRLFGSMFRSRVVALLLKFIRLLAICLLIVPALVVAVFSLAKGSDAGKILMVALLALLVAGLFANKAGPLTIKGLVCFELLLSIGIVLTSAVLPPAPQFGQVKTAPMEVGADLSRRKANILTSHTLSSARARKETAETSPAPSLAAQNAVDLGPFLSSLQESIIQSWFPPRGQESRRVQVIFNVHKKGELSDLRLEKSSGVVLADKSALEAVQNAAPYSSLPDGGPSVVSIQFTFDYNAFQQKFKRRERPTSAGSHNR
jgi:TonB family protein